MKDFSKVKNRKRLLLPPLAIFLVNMIFVLMKYKFATYVYVVSGLTVIASAAFLGWYDNKQFNARLKK